MATTAAQCNERSQSHLRGFEKFDDASIARLVSTVRMNRYHHQVEPMPDRPYVNAYVQGPGVKIGEPIIFINERMREWERCKTYLHESCHLIAQRYGLDEDPRASGHSQYFGVLVAVCYRRAHAVAPGEAYPLSNLCLYEFGDAYGVINGERHPDHANDPDVRPLTDTEMLDRLQFVVRESARYARTDWTIEQIARHLHFTHFQEDGYLRLMKVQPEKPLLPAWVTLAGTAVCVAGMVALASHFGMLASLS